MLWREINNRKWNAKCCYFTSGGIQWPAKVKRKWLQLHIWVKSITCWSETKLVGVNSNICLRESKMVMTACLKEFNNLLCWIAICHYFMFGKLQNVLRWIENSHDYTFSAFKLWLCYLQRPGFMFYLLPVEFFSPVTRFLHSTIESPTQRSVQCAPIN